MRNAIQGVYAYVFRQFIFFRNEALGGPVFEMAAAGGLGGGAP